MQDQRWAYRTIFGPVEPKITVTLHVLFPLGKRFWMRHGPKTIRKEHTPYHCAQVSSQPASNSYAENRANMEPTCVPRSQVVMRSLCNANNELC